MSPSGTVIARAVYPDPGPVKCFTVVPPPTSTSSATVVVTEPLLGDADVPAADAALSNGPAGSSPLYSRILRSGYAVAASKVTDTVLVPAVEARMFAA